MVRPSNLRVRTQVSNGETVAVRLPDSLHIVHGRHGVVGISFLEVSHESETTAASSITIFDDDCFLNGTKLLKLLAKSALLSVPRKAAGSC
jgi:hypothetical protein